jgi:exonuclease SbcC
MIKSLDIKNYQSHINTHIEFSSGVNMITGASDSGKSAALRSLLWNINNRPMGDDFKNWDNPKEETKVEIELFENIKIIKSKNKDSFYELHKPIQLASKLKRRNIETKFDIKRFEAFGTDVPEEITEVFNLSDINIQTQHNPYFLLNDSPGDVSKKFNKLAGLDIIDRVFKNLNRFIAKDTQAINSGSENIKSLKKGIEELNYIDQAKIDVEVCQELIKEKTALENSNNRLWDLCKSIHAIRLEAEKASQIIKAEDEVKKCKSLIEQKEALEVKNNTLANLCLSIKETRQTKEKAAQVIKAESQVKNTLKTYEKYSILSDSNSRLESYLINLKSLKTQISEEKEWLTIEQLYAPLDELTSRYKTLTEKNKSLENNLYSLRSINLLQIDAKNKLYEAKRQYQLFLEKNKICPICNKPIDKKCIDKILEG